MIGWYHCRCAGYRLSGGLIAFAPCLFPRSRYAVCSFDRWSSLIRRSFSVSPVVVAQASCGGWQRHVAPTEERARATLSQAATDVLE
jgi:hypothetical protein